MRFFFYGTLLAGSGNAVARQVHGKLRALGPATAQGRLAAIPDPRGWYPALMPGDCMVHGHVYEALAGFGAAELDLLDTYEDCDPADPQTSEYRRERIRVTSTTLGQIEAWAYLYARPLPSAAMAIEDGDFAGFLRSGNYCSFV